MKMKLGKMNGVRIGKRSWGHIRFGSHVSVIAILVAIALREMAKRGGFSDALWVDIVTAIALILVVADFAYALYKRSPRKRWQYVTSMGVAGGVTLIVVSLACYYVDGNRLLGSQLGAAGLAVLLLLGLGGWLLYRRALRRLNSQLLDRKLQQKKRKHYE